MAINIDQLPHEGVSSLIANMIVLAIDDYYAPEPSLDESNRKSVERYGEWLKNKRSAIHFLKYECEQTYGISREWAFRIYEKLKKQ